MPGRVIRPNCRERLLLLGSTNIGRQEPTATMPPVLGERAEAVSGDLATTDLPFCVANAHTEQRDIPDLSLNIENRKR